MNNLCSNEPPVRLHIPQELRIRSGGTDAQFLRNMQFMQHFTKEQEIINLGLEYANWVLLFTVIIQVSVAYEKIFQSVGRMKVSMCRMMPSMPI